LEEAFNVPNLPEHLVPEEFAGNEWFVEEQYERYQKDKNLVDPSWWPIFETIDKALGGAGTASAPSPAAAAPAGPATPPAAPAGPPAPRVTPPPRKTAPDVSAAHLR